jgi:type I restriction enzyme S subunit
MQNTVKATVDSLRLPTFQTFILQLPPTLEEQNAIAEFLVDINTELDLLDERRNKTAALKQGMMQELLTGRTRLI